MRSKHKKLTIIGGALVLLMVVALQVASVYLNSADMRGRAIEMVNAAIQGRIRLADHHLSLLSGQLILSGIELTGVDGQSAASIQQLKLRIFWPVLAWRAIHVLSLKVEQAQVALIHDAQDRLNIIQIFEPKTPTAAAPAQASTSWQLIVDDVQVHLAGISYQRPAAGMAVEGQQIQVTGHGNLLRRAGQLQLRIGHIAIKAPDVDEAFDQVTLSAGYDQQAGRPIRLAIRALDSNVAVQGYVDWSSNPLQLTASGDLDLELKHLQTWLPKELDLAGRAKAKLAVNGAWDDPTANVQLTVIEGGVAGIAFQQVEAKAELLQRKLTLHGLTINADWGQVDLAGSLDLQPVFQHTFQHAEADIDRAAYALDMRCKAVKPARISRLDSPLQGVWQGRAHLEGTGFSIEQAAVKLDTALSVEAFQLAHSTKSMDGNFSLVAQWDDQVLKVQHLQAALGTNTVQAHGRILWKKKEFDGQGTVTSSRISDIGALWGIALPDGQAAIKISGQGPWQLPCARLSMTADDLAMAGWTFGRLTAEANLDKDGIVHLPSLLLENGNGCLQGHGRLDLLHPQKGWHNDPALNFRFDVIQLALADFTSHAPANAVLNGRLTLGGTLLEPVADLTLTDSLAQWQEAQCQAAGAARWDNGLLTISRLHLTKGASAMDLRASAQWRDAHTQRWTADPIVHAKLKADAIQLQDLLPKAKGALTAEVDVRGPISALQGTFGLNANELEVAGQKVEALAMGGRLADNTLHVAHLSVTPAPGQPALEGNGWYAFDQRFQAELKISDLELLGLDALQKKQVISGRLNLNVDAGGTIANPHMTASLRINTPAVNQQPFDDFLLELGLLDQLLTVKADLNFEVNGRCRLDNGEFDLAAGFDKTDLAPYLALGLDDQWAGRLSGHLQAAGNWHAPSKIKADVALSDATLLYQKTDLLSFEKLEARWENGMVHLPSTRLKLLQDGYLTVAADGDILHDAKATVQGRLPVAALAPFTDAIERAGGELIIDLRAQGPWDAIQWRAEVVPVNVGGILTDLDQAVHDLNGRVLLSPQQIDIKTLSGMLEDGHFTLNGRIQLADWQPNQYDLAFNAQALPLHIPNTLDVKVNADLTLTGDSRSSMLDGKLVILEGAYYKNLRYDLLSTFKPQRAQAVPNTSPPPPWRQAVGLNVTLTSRYPFLVDNNVARLEIKPDLKITGTLAHPLINGRTNVNSGDIIFQGKSFTVKRGVIDFLNPYRIEPTLDILAETQMRQWRISLSVTGTPDNLLIKLSSDPPESDANILALIVLGKTSGEYSQTSGPQTDSSQRMMAAFLTAALGDNIKKETGVDIFEMQSGAVAETDSANRMQLTVGKNLTARLTLKYELESNNEERIQRAVSEYRLLEHILASGFQDTGGNYGGELMFRIEFR